MKATVQKWGNSLAVRIPRAVAAETGMDNGAPVEISARDGAVVIMPQRPRRKYKLAELVEGITKSNRHEAVDWGRPAGKELW
jgi:antitoxin MazE